MLKRKCGTGASPSTLNNFHHLTLETTDSITMAFAIEVPGESVPLGPQQVYQALQSAGSSQQLHIQTGTQQLQAWETQRGYYTLLQVRRLATLLLRPENIITN